MALLGNMLVALLVGGAPIEGSEGSCCANKEDPSTRVAHEKSTHRKTDHPGAGEQVFKGKKERLRGGITEMANIFSADGKDHIFRNISGMISNAF